MKTNAKINRYHTQSNKLQILHICIRTYKQQQQHICTFDVVRIDIVIPVVVCVVLVDDVVVVVVLIAVVVCLVAVVHVDVVRFAIVVVLVVVVVDV